MPHDPDTQDRLAWVLTAIIAGCTPFVALRLGESARFRMAIHYIPLQCYSGHNSYRYCVIRPDT